MLVVATTLGSVILQSVRLGLVRLGSAMQIRNGRTAVSWTGISQVGISSQITIGHTRVSQIRIGHAGVVACCSFVTHTQVQY